MNDTARTMLARLIALNGVSIAHDANRCEGLLRDTCPECTRRSSSLSMLCAST